MDGLHSVLGATCLLQRLGTSIRARPSVFETFSLSIAPMIRRTVVAALVPQCRFGLISCFSTSAPLSGRPHIPSPPTSIRRTHNTDPTPTSFRKHRETMKKKFPEGWSPPKKLSREAMEGLRALHAHDPDTFTTPMLADKFKISPEAVRRILRSKWTPSEERRVELLEKEDKLRQEARQRRFMDERQATRIVRPRDGRDGLSMK